MGLMAVSILLVIVTLVCGFRIGESPVFLFTECIMMLISSSFSLFIFEEVSEEILLITWSLFQTLRMIFIAKK